MALIDTYRNNVTRKRAEIAKLTADKAKEKSKIAKARTKIDNANSAINRTKNATTVKSKMRDILSAEKDSSHLDYQFHCPSAEPQFLRKSLRIPPDSP